MSHAAEFTAAMPEAHAVMGLRLLPLSIGRYRMMARHDCAYVREEEATATPEDLLFGAVVCAQRVDEFERKLESGELEKELKRYGKRLVKSLKKAKEFNLFFEMAKFKLYIEEGQQLPWVVMEKNQSNESSPCHWSSSVEIVLRSKAGWTKEEIDEQPLTKALADYWKIAEAEGAVTLYSRDAADELQAMAEANGVKMAQAFNQNN